MAAYVLTRAGIKVLVLEAGRDYDPQTESAMFQWPHQAPLRAVSTPDKHFGYYDATAGGGWEVPGEPYSNAPGSTFRWWRSRMLGGRTNHWGRHVPRFTSTDTRFGNANSAPATLELTAENATATHGGNFTVPVNNVTKKGTVQLSATFAQQRSETVLNVKADGQNLPVTDLIALSKAAPKDGSFWKAAQKATAVLSSPALRQSAARAARASQTAANGIGVEAAPAAAAPRSL